MEWKGIYDNLIKKARLENRSKNSGTYYEEHHIIPEHVGGSDEKENLVLLNFREHVLAHYILWRIYKRLGDKVMYLMRSGQKEEAQKLRVQIAVYSNRNGGKGFENWKGDKHPMKNTDTVKRAINTKRKKYGKTLNSDTEDIKRNRKVVAKERANRPEVKQKRANTIRAINATLTKEEKLKKYQRQKEKNANWGRVKGYYVVINPSGENIKYESQKEIVEKLNITQSFLIRNRNKGVILKEISYLPNGSFNSGKWNGWEFKYYKNPHPKTGKIEKQHKTHKK
jgi:hypothetical protein